MVPTWAIDNPGPKTFIGIEKPSLVETFLNLKYIYVLYKLQKKPFLQFE